MDGFCLSMAYAFPRAEVSFLDIERGRRSAHAECDRSYGFGYKTNLFFKRILDIVLSSLMIVMASPLLVAIAVAVRLTSSGPVFFRQERVGVRGRIFEIWKYRTMFQGEAKREHQQFIKNLLDKDPEKSGDSAVLDDFMAYLDKRITPVGGFLRASSLDELPQLFNIFLGQMSFVGPRPHPVYEVDEYKEWYRKRLQVKPGLTGWSKLKLRLTPKNYEEAILYDLWYVENWNFLLDLKIILMTVPFVLSMRDAH